MKRMIMSLAVATAFIAAPVAAIAQDNNKVSPVAGDKRDPSRSQRVEPKPSDKSATADKGATAGTPAPAGTAKVSPPAGDKRDPARSQRVDPKPDTAGTNKDKM